MSRLRVRLTPGAKKNEILGMKNGVLRLKVAAPPVEGKANAAATAYLAGLLRLKRRQVRLVSGEKSREKVFEVEREATELEGLLGAKKPGSG